MLKVAIPADTEPVIRSVFEEAARRVADVAEVRLWPVARLPDEVPFVMIVRDGRRPSARWHRAARAFEVALRVVAGKTLAVADVDDDPAEHSVGGGSAGGQ